MENWIHFLGVQIFFFHPKSEQSLCRSPPSKRNPNIVRIFKIHTLKWIVDPYQPFETLYEMQHMQLEFEVT